MSVTSLARRGGFPIEARNMKNQPPSYSMYDDDESPIDLTKKPAINRPNGSEIRDRSTELPLHAMATSPEASEDEHDKRSEFLHAIQKMSAMAVPPFLNPLWMVNPKEMEKRDGICGIHNPRYGGTVGYHPFSMSNPYVINPVPLANLYPFVSEQYGVGYAMVNSPDGAHVVPIPVGQQSYTRHEASESRDTKTDQQARKPFLCETNESLDGTKNGGRMDKTVERFNVNEGIKSFPSPGNDQSDSYPSGVANRCASTPPDSDFASHRKLKDIRHLRETWKSDSRLLSSKSPCRSKFRCTGGGSLDQAILRLHCSKQKLPTQPTFASQRTPSKKHLTRSRSCSDLSRIHHRDSNRNSAKFRYHSGYGSDNEISSSTSLSSSWSSLKSVDSKKMVKIHLSSHKRKSLGPSDDSDSESTHSTHQNENYIPPSDKHAHNAKRLKGFRSLSEPSILNKIAPSRVDYPTPTDLSMKTPSPAVSLSLGDAESYLRQLGKISPGGIPWNIYGYYNHLMQRFQDQEMLKRHLELNVSNSHHLHHPRETPSPSTGEAGLSPPPSPPENYSSLTSSGGWLDPSPPEDRCDAGTPEDGTSSNDPNNKKRPSRALTGKHVKHGTGASPSTLITLRQKIQERQKAKELGIRTDKGAAGHKAVSFKAKSNPHKKQSAQRHGVNKKDKPKQDLGDKSTS